MERPGEGERVNGVRAAAPPERCRRPGLLVAVVIALGVVAVGVLPAVRGVTDLLRGGGAGPAAAGAAGGGRIIAARHEIAAGDAVIRLDQVTMYPDHLVLDMALRNPTDGYARIMLGGCGPSQGAIHTEAGWTDVYYDHARSDGDSLFSVPPGEFRRGKIVLRTLSDTRLEGAAVTRLDLHPGYLIVGPGQVERLNIDIPVEPRVGARP